MEVCVELISTFVETFLGCFLISSGLFSYPIYFPDAPTERPYKIGVGCLWKFKTASSLWNHINLRLENTYMSISCDLLNKK